MNTKITPRDFFLHLGATVALYATVIALINLSFSVINYYFPDQLAGYFYNNNIVWPISMLVILTPLLYILEYFINRDIRKTPEKENFWIRNWRIFLTLFLTGATIAGDLIALINVYLNGEISERFIYKILAVLLISGVVFVYYLLMKTQGTAGLANNQNHNTRTIFAWIGIVLVLVTVVSGFLAVGSPTKQRNLRFDSQRVSDLNNIQWQIVNYWQQKRVLPATLSDLNDSIGGYDVPTDPKNKSVYEYIIKSQAMKGVSTTTAFEICATFALATPDNKGRGDFYGGNSYPTIAMSTVGYGGIYGDEAQNWKHSAGHTCFTRTIDPDKYPASPEKPLVY